MVALKINEGHWHCQKFGKCWCEHEFYGHSNTQNKNLMENQETLLFFSKYVYDKWKFIHNFMNNERMSQ